MRKMKLPCAASLSFLVLSLLLPSLPGCAWFQRHEPSIDCAVLAAVEDAPQLVGVVESCMTIAVTQAAIVPCVEGAASSKWTNDVIGCFTQSAQGRAKCPLFDAAKTIHDAEQPVPLKTSSAPYLSYTSNGTQQTFAISSSVCVVGQFAIPEVSNFVVFNNSAYAVAYQAYEQQKGNNLGLFCGVSVAYFNFIGFRLVNTGVGLSQQVGTAGQVAVDTKGAQIAWSTNPNMYLGEVAYWNSFAGDKALTQLFAATLTH